MLPNYKLSICSFMAHLVHGWLKLCSSGLKLGCWLSPLIISLICKVGYGHKKLNYYYSYRTVLLSIPFYKETNLQCVTFFKVSNYLKRMLRDYLRVTHGEVWAAKQFPKMVIIHFPVIWCLAKRCPRVTQVQAAVPI